MTETSIPDSPTAPTSGSRVRAPIPGDPVLVAVGAAGLVVAVLDLVAVAARGGFIAPEGKMLDAATFSFGVAVFTLTVALLLPLAGYSPRGQRRWRWAYCVFAVYGLVLESVQAFRGVDPRFTDTGTDLDVYLGIVFGLTALLNTTVFVILGLRFLRSDVLVDRPVLRLGIRYGVAAVWMSFGVGILMSILAGRETSEEGNLLLSHGLGVHGIQAVPVVALLLTWSGPGLRASWVHAAGIGWLAAGAAALVQALLGVPPLDVSLLSLVIVVGVALWAVVAAYVLLAWRRATAEPPAPDGSSGRTG